MLRRDAMAVLRQALRIVADDVSLQPVHAALARRDRHIVLGRPLDRLFAAGDRRPDRRTGLLDRPRPHGHVLVGPELAVIGEDVLAPGASDDVVGFLEARAGLRERDVVYLVFARDAAGDAG